MNISGNKKPLSANDFSNIVCKCMFCSSFKLHQNEYLKLSWIDREPEKESHTEPIKDACRQ